MGLILYLNLDPFLKGNKINKNKSIVIVMLDKDGPPCLKKLHTFTFHEHGLSDSMMKLHRLLKELGN